MHQLSFYDHHAHGPPHSYKKDPNAKCVHKQLIIDFGFLSCQKSKLGYHHHIILVICTNLGILSRHFMHFFFTKYKFNFLP